MFIVYRFKSKLGAAGSSRSHDAEEAGADALGVDRSMVKASLQHLNAVPEYKALQAAIAGIGQTLRARCLPGYMPGEYLVPVAKQPELEALLDDKRDAFGIAKTAFLNSIDRIVVDVERKTNGKMRLPDRQSWWDSRIFCYARPSAATGGPLAGLHPMLQATILEAQELEKEEIRVLHRRHIAELVSAPLKELAKSLSKAEGGKRYRLETATKMRELIERAESLASQHPDLDMALTLAQAAIADLGSADSLTTETRTATAAAADDLAAQLEELASLEGDGPQNRSILQEG